MNRWFLIEISRTVDVQIISGCSITFTRNLCWLAKHGGYQTKLSGISLFAVVMWIMYSQQSFTISMIRAIS